MDYYMIEIQLEPDIVIARSKGRELAKSIGFGLIDSTYIATVISEFARNILENAGSGYIRIEKIMENGKLGILVIAEDLGPGIEDIELVLIDGYTTNGGLGLGLPGAQRMMDVFEIQSKVGEGTKVIAKKWMP